MEDPRIISALFIFLKMAYYNVLINTILLYSAASSIVRATFSHIATYCLFIKSFPYCLTCVAYTSIRNTHNHSLYSTTFLLSPFSYLQSLLVCLCLQHTLAYTFLKCGHRYAFYPTWSRFLFHLAEDSL